MLARKAGDRREAVHGAVLGTIDLGGTPVRGVADGRGMLYVVMQDAVGSVTAVDVRTMKLPPRSPRIAY
jgi:hypothetical protein